MTSDERRAKVAEAWASAYDRISASYGDNGPTIDQIRSYAPARANDLEAAEREAEEASVSWQNGGKGGVQKKLDRWVELYLQAIEDVRSAA